MFFVSPAQQHDLFQLKPIQGPLGWLSYYFKMVIFALLHLLLLIICGIFITLTFPLQIFRQGKLWSRQLTHFYINVFIEGIKILNRLLNSRVTIEGDLNLGGHQHYLVICNHQSWFDILLIQWCFKDIAPPLKFFPKKELKKVPFIGLACYAMGCPFIDRRNTERAIESIRDACEEFKDEPACYVIYVEGTRFSAEKKKQQPKNDYRHLLMPRPRGLSITVQALNLLEYILDVTLVFPKGCNGFADYFGGRVREIKIFIKRRSITEALRNPSTSLPEASNLLTQWWREKDELIDQTQKIK